ncbi:MAG: DUF402 domain-containing protein [Anaerolineales bacterium]|nr:DUF402 domain-containing protein [Anaerolineales bacterium]
MDSITVIKKDLEGNETWRYSGRLLDRSSDEITIEALFNRADTPFHEISLLRGDRFVEIYYSNRWYNIYAIHDREDGHIKGWYCNVSYPAEIGEDHISFVDLALDLLVYPDGRQLVLDEDEFAALPLTSTDRAQAREALNDLEELFLDGPPEIG